MHCQSTYNLTVAVFGQTVVQCLNASMRYRIINIKYLITILEFVMFSSTSISFNFYLVLICQIKQENIVWSVNLFIHAEMFTSNYNSTYSEFFIISLQML